jgi:hypothetical protein
VTDYPSKKTAHMDKRQRIADAKSRAQANKAEIERAKVAGSLAHRVAEKDLKPLTTELCIPILDMPCRWPGLFEESHKSPDPWDAVKVEHEPAGAPSIIENDKRDPVTYKMPHESESMGKDKKEVATAIMSLFNKGYLDEHTTLEWICRAQEVSQATSMEWFMTHLESELGRLIRVATKVEWTDFARDELKISVSPGLPPRDPVLSLQESIRKIIADHMQLCETFSDIDKKLAGAMMSEIACQFPSMRALCGMHRRFQAQVKQYRGRQI